MKNHVMAEAKRKARVRAAAEQLVGAREWSFVEEFGKLMAGPHAGLYVKSRPAEEWLEIAECLVAGQTLHIHLMHRHRSGRPEESTLRWQDGQLLMVFSDREEPA